ncbi:hypothetical protein ICHIAU1_04420 [Fluviibacter phosphoraccumulans]|uniref:Uncharacterized protein n=1 Tax=Fluviibacter phosphoraccumulans TaxID=1751046 RepID=A0A679HVE3_9RHOO|nr:hypothetical protein ICHIAU1_04420 [Fluviibacter phosphoraccumulans]BCA66336.1 hypothetical protein SHINM1_019380 [Fluviibacter phosphoraccumulans]
MPLVKVLLDAAGQLAITDKRVKAWRFSEQTVQYAGRKHHEYQSGKTEGAHQLNKAATVAGALGK